MHKVGTRLLLGFITLSFLIISGIATINQNNVYADAPTNMEDPEQEVDSMTGVNYLVSGINTFTQTQEPNKDDDAISFQLLSVQSQSGSNVIYFNKAGYDKNNVDVKRDVLSKLYSLMQSSEMTDRDKNRLDNWIQSIDQTNSTIVKQLSQSTEPDIVDAVSFFLPFQSKLGVFLGIMVIIIAIGLTLSYVWDIAFLTIPFFEALLTKNKDNAGTLDMNNRPLFVTQDAIMAYNEAYGSSTMRPVLGVWFKYRVKTSILIGILLVYIMSNQIWDLIAFIVDFLGRIF